MKVKKIACLLLLLPSGYIMAQTKTVVTQYGERVNIHPNVNNGLTANNGYMQLGGALTQPSILTTSSDFTLAINGLQAGDISDNVLVTNANGILKYVSRDNFGGADNLGNHIAVQNLDMSSKNILNISTAYIKNEVQIKDRVASYTNYFGLYKNNGSFGIWNNLKNSNAITIEENSNNVGIGTITPTNTLHVKANTDPVKIEGMASSTNNNDSPIVITSNGTLKKGAFPVVNIIPDDVGTVIAVDGKLEVAQEITAQMITDFSFPITVNNIPNAIGNIDNVIIDNKNTFIHNATSNSFKVLKNGVYLISLNIRINTIAGTPVMGIWSDTDGVWVARINGSGSSLTNLTLLTSINMDSTRTYSFRVGNTSSGTVAAFNSGASGTGPISFFSLKRLK